MLFGPKRVTALGEQLGKSLRSLRNSLDKAKGETGLGDVAKSVGDFQQNVNNLKDSVNPLKSSPVEAKKTLRISDRKEAIRTACTLAKSGDIILIAGKGHEKYQEIKGVKHDFDDYKLFKETISAIEV